LATFVERVAQGLDDVLGASLVSMFLYGSVAFPHPENWLVDVDFHVVVEHPFDAGERNAIHALYDELASASAFGRELDGWIVTLDDARRSSPPAHQLDPAMRDDSWALHRAHVHAGRYFRVRGLDPCSIVPTPSWSELEAGLCNELRYVETHPQHIAFGILNGCRIVYSVRHHDVVVSKHAAAQWARDALDPSWRPGIDAAVRAYSRAPAEGDDIAMTRTWPAIVDAARRVVAG
jgi:Domain of unknown function (DUF4111)